jgi:hypothetical protein
VPSNSYDLVVLGDDLAALRLTDIEHLEVHHRQAVAVVDRPRVAGDFKRAGQHVVVDAENHDVQGNRYFEDLA